MNYLQRVLRYTKNTAVRGLWRVLQPLIRTYVRRRLLTRDHLPDHSSVFMRFGAAEHLELTAPASQHRPPRAILRKIGSYRIPRPFVCEVPEATLIGPSAVGLTSEGELILETTVAREDVLNSSLMAVAQKKMNPFHVHKGNEELELESACSLVNYWSRGYFHWILECLTRLQGLRYYEEQTGCKPALIIDSDPPPWMLDSLRLMGYDPPGCIQWDGTRARIERLVLPSFRREHGRTSSAACRWVRQQILAQVPEAEEEGTTPEKIYISRRDAQSRRVVNEDEVLKVLGPLGFVAYALDGKSFDEQVRLFSRAKAIVAPHGAGLTNMIWAERPSIIELFGSYINPCYFALSKGLGFDYGFLEGRSEGQDMIVDVGGLRRLIAKMAA